jgi:nucleoside-diphosphate-sugar epimerase
MKILVTGGAGFIGSHIVERLVKDGHGVRVFDNFSTGRRENLAAVAGRIEFFEGDIRDFPAVCQAVRSCDVVFHEAALCSVTRSVQKPQDTNAVNIDGTLNVLVAARDKGAKRLVFASSSSVYGNSETHTNKTRPTLAPASPYAVTKLAGELYCNNFFKLFGLETFALRYFNVFGPRQDPNSQYAAVIPKFISALLKGEPPAIEGDGLQTRDFSYVDNVVDANLAAMKAQAGFGEAFDIACGQSTTVLQLADYLEELLEVAIKPVYVPPRPGDVRHSLADISRAKDLLSYQPSIDVKSGLRSTVDWYHHHTLLMKTNKENAQ